MSRSVAVLRRKPVHGRRDAGAKLGNVGGGLCTPHQGVRLGDMVLKFAPLLMENDKYP